MPKLRQSDMQLKDNQVRAYIAKNMALYGFSDEEVAIKLRCTKRTFQNKKKRPETFTLKELRVLCDVLKFENEEKLMLM